MPEAATAPPPPAPAPAAAPPAPAAAPKTDNDNVSRGTIPPPEPRKNLRQEIGADFEAIEAAEKQPRNRADGRFSPRQAEVKPPEGEPKPGDPPVPEPEAGEPVRLPDMRRVLKERKQKLSELEPKVAQLERELADARKGVADPKPMQEKMTALEKQNAELLEEIRYVNYQKHPEFIKNYQEKYNESWAKATGEITQLNIETESGQVRKATANDLLALANAPLDQLDDLAEKWFGRSSARVIRHVEKIRDLAEAQDKALTDARKTAGEREKQQITERDQRNGLVSKNYTETQREITAKYPKWFAPDPADPEGNTALEKAAAYADSVFNGNGALTGEQKAKRLAVIRAKAIGFDRQVLRNNALAGRIAELEADLAEYEKSEPGAGTAGNPPRGGTQKRLTQTVNEEFDTLDRK